MKPLASQHLAQRWSEELRSAQIPADPGWMSGLRERALKQFSESGLPHRKVEAWKYTPLRLLLDSEPELTGPPAVPGSFPGPLVEDAAILDLTDGYPASPLPELPPGVTVRTFQEGVGEFEDRLRRMAEQVEISGPDRAFAALNTAFIHQGLVVHVEEGVDAGRLLLRWTSTANGRARFAQSRIVILLEPGAQLELLEQYQGDGDDGDALNVMIQADLAEGAHWRHIRLQDEADSRVVLTSTSVRQSAASRYTSNSFDLGGGLVRHETATVLDGPGAHADIAGAFVLDERRHVDHHVSVDHAVPNCSSEQFFRGVLGGRSRGVFNGRALIRPGADGSSVVQSNANLLLSRLAEMDTKPELEIYADEVEASHGATVGQLDEAAVFYLRSRGLSSDAARRTLTTAFCLAVTDRLEDRELAAKLAALVEEAMPKQDAGQPVAS
jgi:Fe-S cluster assembly protein SufD